MSGARPWREVLGVVGDWTLTAPREALLAFAKAQYRTLIAEHHTDKGGDHALAAEINAAMEEAERELKPE